MRVQTQRLGWVIGMAAIVGTLPACATKTARHGLLRGEVMPQETYVPTAVPTVPPSGTDMTPTPEPAKTPTRKAKPGEPIGPEITYLGITRADGGNIDPVSVDKHGIPTFVNYVGSGFQIVVEAKPGFSGDDVAQRLFAYSPKDPKLQPDLQIEVSRPLGDGSTVVCDRSRPNIGGIPGIHPTSFAETQKVSNALNDLACRFELFLDSESACSLDKNGDWAYKMKDTKIQFCMMVARAWNFPHGKTLVSVRLRDRAGNPGPVKKIWISRPKMAPTPRPVPTKPPTPKALPTR